MTRHSREHLSSEELTGRPDPDIRQSNNATCIKRNIKAGIMKSSFRSMSEGQKKKLIDIRSDTRESFIESLGRF